MRAQSWVRKIPLEENTATHSSILAWRIPWAEETGRLQSIGSQSRTQLKRFSMNAWKHNKGSSERIIFKGVHMAPVVKNLPFG